MKKIISLIALTAMLAVPVFAQTSANIRVNTLNALVQLPILSTNMSAMVSGNAAIGDGGFAGDFTYDSTSSAATNTYSVFKPAATTGRWIRRNEAAWNQFTAATASDGSTYAFSMRRNLQTNVFNLGADNNNVYLQSQASYALHLNNIGNNTVLNSTAGFVGIGQPSPSVALHVRNSVNLVDTLFRLESANTGITETRLDWVLSDTAATATQAGWIGLGKDASWTSTASTRDSYLNFTASRDGTIFDALRISSDGNLGLFTSTFGSSANRVFALANGTAPGSSPADMVQVYSSDVTAGNAALFIRGEDGSIASIGDGGLAFTGAQAVSTTTGNLSLTTGGGNGNVALAFNGTGGLTVGGGSGPIVLVASAAASLNFGNIVANTSLDLTISVTGAGTNSVVSIGTDGAGVALESGITLTGFVTATNVVTIRAANVTAGAIDPAARSVRATVFQY